MALRILYVIIFLTGFGVIPGQGAAFQLSETRRAVVPGLVSGKVENLGSVWQLVSLPYSYENMVVVATPQYGPEQLPAVVRVRNATGNSFEISIQNPSNEPLAGYTAQYLVVEAGIYTLAEHGVKMEAARTRVADTDYKGKWIGQPAGFSNAYTSPVVMGQVLTYNDPRWSVFWSHGFGATNPPGFGFLYIGKHVGEDPDQERLPEEVGYIVFEAGIGEINGDSHRYDFQAIAGEDIVGGFVVNPPFSYEHNLDDTGFVVASLAGIDGGNGAWAVLWGDAPIADGLINLVADEDQTIDDERNHTSEQAHAVIFNILQPAPQIISFTPSKGGIGTEINIQGQFFTNVTSVSISGIPVGYTVISPEEIEMIVPEGATSGPILIQTAGGLASSQSSFEIFKSPEITTFTPEEGVRGAEIDIIGENFIEVLDVTFGGWSSPSYEVISETLIRATVPSSSKTGRIRVRNVAGMATTPEVFVVLPSRQVTAFSPARGEIGSTLQMSGLGFLEAEAVIFSGDIATAVSVQSDTSLFATVPPNARSGPIELLLSDADTLRSSETFIVTFAEAQLGENLCRLTTATVSQSSNGPPLAIPEKACDGLTEGLLATGSIAATDEENEAWWETDLKAVYPIDRIDLWAPTDCCEDSLMDLFVFVSEHPFLSQSLSTTLADPAVSAYLVNEMNGIASVTTDRPGRYVRIQHGGTAALTLAEVEIMAGNGPGVNLHNEPPDDGETLVLETPFPSPFTAQTQIGFVLPESGPVRLTVYNALGREIQVLEESILGRGRHEVTFEAPHLPSGVYYVRLQAGREVHNASIVITR